MFALNDGDRIVTAWAEHATGPGWSNQLVWVLVRERTGGLREEAIQPEDQTTEMQTLFWVCEAATKALTAAVERATRISE